jgi:hypothetical protein
VRGALGPLGVAIGIAWLASNCYEKQGGAWVRTCFPSEQPPEISDGYKYWTNYDPVVGGVRATHNTARDACVYAGGRIDSLNGAGWVSTYTGTTGNESTLACSFTQTFNGAPRGTATETLGRQGNPACPAGWYVTPAGCIQSYQPQPVTVEQIEADMAGKPLPATLPLGVPYPLDPSAPFIFNPTPGDSPIGQPLRVPQGNPVPVPNTNPQQYRQPVTRWASSPTASEPWRMSADPQDVISESPQGMTEPQSETSGTPSGEKPEQFDLCKEHPDIIACQVFKPDELDAKPIVDKQVPLALNAEGGFPMGGSCPQPKSVVLMGKTFAFSMQPLCDFALGIKPLLIGFAWLSAALVFLGVARREN